MQLKLEGQTAMISGASKGIGARIAHSLAAQGVNLSISARDGETLGRTADRLRDKYKIDCLAIAGDMGDQQFIEDWTAKTAETFKKIDVLINNAGSSPPGGFDTQTDDEWQDAFKVKPFGYIRAARAALPYLKETKGRIVNIIGLAGHQPLPKFFIGGAGDGALMNFTKSLADDVAAFGVRVNAISPGFTRTERWEVLVAGSGAMMGVSPEQAEKALLSSMPLGRPAEMEEIASTVLFLVSGMSSYITGVTIPVDGGATRSI
ncbi:SDR family oxidoreductase [Sneathiella aquimaris]|uniref:SDR family oxidoreductase n=1 Tax=Sneathiella aquimaris TaxID=2599305 RepID=UPI00146EF273|nr:SDR family oxidoreductase [Sneathiella aquimaris]